MGRFQGGDEEGFQTLFDRYAAHLINFAHRSLNSREESEDVAQEVLLRVYRSKDRFDASRPFRPWVFSMAVRLIYNRLRDRKRHPGFSLDQKPDEDRPGPELPDQSPLPSESLEKQHLAREVRKALDGLPENQRTAVLLARFEEMSYTQIAEAMGVSVTAVKSLLFRAKQTLKSSLASHVRPEDEIPQKA
jgi:RNA polymerase sigma-70 factor, ECF subfamily